MTGRGNEDLLTALEEVTAGCRPSELQAATRQLITTYRSPTQPSSSTLATAEAATAYAVYRMPATYAAVRAALGAAVRTDPALAPRTLLDIGGGTGAALWAAAHTFPTTLGSATVLDRSRPALDLGRALAHTQSTPVLRNTTWTTTRLDASSQLPQADLVTLAYVLAELPPAERHAVVSAACAVADVLAVVEPGTPAGYSRMLEARQALIGYGFAVLAPCPHQGTCPLADGPTWCHFSVRLQRSALHRRAKGAVLGHEDEKFSYVVAAKAPGAPGPDRVIGHPRIRTGMVDLEVCTAQDGVHPLRVTKKQGPIYRAARNARWGSGWEPPQN